MVRTMLLGGAGRKPIINLCRKHSPNDIIKEQNPPMQGTMLTRRLLSNIATEGHWGAANPFFLLYYLYT